MWLKDTLLLSRWAWSTVFSLINSLFVRYTLIQHAAVQTASSFCSKIKHSHQIVTWKLHDYETFLTIKILISDYEVCVHTHTHTMLLNDKSASCSVLAHEWRQQKWKWMSWSSMLSLWAGWFLSWSGVHWFRQQNGWVKMMCFMSFHWYFIRRVSLH